MALTTRNQAPPREAWVERVRQDGERVVVDLLLADGSRSQVSLGAGDAEWLELGPGQIVSLKPAGLPGRPGLALVG